MIQVFSDTLGCGRFISGHLERPKCVAPTRHTFAKNGLKWTFFLDQWTKNVHLAGNNFWIKIFPKMHLLTSKLCNSPFFIIQSAYSAVLWIFQNWKFSKHFQKKTKNFLPNLAQFFVLRPLIIVKWLVGTQIS